MISLPRHPKYNMLKKGGGSASFGRIRLLSALEQSERWDDLITACESNLIEPTEDKKEIRKRLRLMGVAYFQTGKRTQADQIIADFNAMLKEAEAKIAPPEPESEEEAKAEKKKETTEEKAFKGLKKELDPLIAELSVWRSLADEDTAAAIEQLGAAKNMNKMRMAQARLACGQTNETVKLARKMIEKKEQPVLPLARAAWLLDQCGETKEADEAFARLREISSMIDLDLDVFARLKPCAERAGLSADWRLPLEVPKDIGVRPDLDTLGPFRWQPVEAPAWALKDSTGKTRSLHEYKGKPVVVFFYLGFGCLHCVEQLQAFAPEIETFREAGIELIGISTSPLEALQSDLADFQTEEPEIPFPLVADPSLEVFKSYRAYDDFEKEALHGTFLLDAEGKIRWQDISYEPFSDVAFLIKEAKRLLKK
jgi:peroxiredoxin